MGYVRGRFYLLSLSLLGSHFLAILCASYFMHDKFADFFLFKFHTAYEL